MFRRAWKFIKRVFRIFEFFTVGEREEVERLERRIDQLEREIELVHDALLTDIVNIQTKLDNLK